MCKGVLQQCRLAAFSESSPLVWFIESHFPRSLLGTLSDQNNSVGEILGLCRDRDASERGHLLSPMGPLLLADVQCFELLRTMKSFSRKGLFGNNFHGYLLTHPSNSFLWLFAFREIEGTAWWGFFLEKPFDGLIVKKELFFFFSLINHSVLFPKANVALDRPINTVPREGPLPPGAWQRPQDLSGGGGKHTQPCPQGLRSLFFNHWGCSGYPFPLCFSASVNKRNSSF